MNDQIKREFLEMIHNYQGILHKVCLIYFTEEADRRDNFQEILYQLWKAYPNLQKKESIGSWIYKISINTSISKIRKESRMFCSGSFPDIPDTEDFFERFATKEHVRLLLEAIRNLNEIDRSLMFLFLENRSYAEISDIMGITVSNVGTKINRIKSQLRKNLKHIGYGK